MADGRHSVRWKTLLIIQLTIALLVYRTGTKSYRRQNTTQLIENEIQQNISTVKINNQASCLRRGQHGRGKRYLAVRNLHTVKGTSSFQLNRLALCGDIQSNPGPRTQSAPKYPCKECGKSVRNNQDAILCSECSVWSHAKCLNMSKGTFRYFLKNPTIDWVCPLCSLACPGKEPENIETPQGDSEEKTALGHDYLGKVASELNSSPKDLRVAHINICSLRNKLDELRELQKICSFDVIGITENHLNSSIPDNELHIEGLKFIRLDRTKCKGGGCMLYYAEHLKATHRKDLAKKDLEAIWIQIKFPSNSVLLSVMYRSELEAPNFFEDVYEQLEKAWMKTSNIFLIGDFNCDLLEINNAMPKEKHTKTKRLLSLLQLFNMQNVVKEATRITPKTQSPIDLIVTTKPELVRMTGVMPLAEYLITA